MKSYFRVFLILYTLLASVPVIAADTYFVIHVKGTVTNQTTGNSLKVGDKISSEDKIKFNSSDAAAVIMGPKGKFTLTPTANASNNTSELTAFVKASMLPLKSNGHLSTRGEETTGVADIKGYFGASQFVIIGNKLSVEVNPLKYPLNEKQIFVFRYSHEGTVVSKKVASQGNTLVFDKMALYTNKGVFIDPSKVKTVDLYYMNTSTNKSQKVASFNPVFLNEATLKEELQVQKNILKEQNKSEEETSKELLSFIFDVYGKTDEKVFKDWVKQNLN